MNNKTWCISFENVQTGEKAYREFPQIAQWSTRALLNKHLQERSYLQEYIVSDIQLLALEKIKHEMADILGSLVYA